MPDTISEIDLYAEALLCLGRAAGGLDAVERDVAHVRQVMRDMEPVRRFFADPAVRADGKRAAVDSVFGEGLAPALKHLLLILVEQERLRDWPAIAEAFLGRAAALRHRATGEIVCARDLSPERLRAIEEAVGRRIGRDVSLRMRVDPRLLGGVIVRVGDIVIDGTVDRQLESMRRELLA